MRTSMPATRWMLALALWLIGSVAAGPSLGAETLQEKLFAVPSDRAGEEEEPDPKPLGEEIPDWKARWELARLLSYTGRYEESVAAYRRVLSEKPELTEARVELARVLYWNDEPEKALQIFEEAPGDALTVSDRIVVGDLFAFRKRYDRAVAAYLQVLEEHPGRSDVRFRLAEVYTWAERYDQALASYRRVLQEDPDNVQARRKYAHVLAWTGDREEAIRQLKRTLP